MIKLQNFYDSDGNPGRRQKAFPLNMNQFRTDNGLVLLKPIERYIYLELMFWMWEGSPRGWLRRGSDPMTLKNFARVINMRTARVEGVVAHLIHWGIIQIDNGVYYSEYLVNMK